MNKRNRMVFSLIGGLAALAAAPLSAAPVNVDGYLYDLPAATDKNLDAARVLISASDALGMTRRGGTCAANANCLGTITASHEYRMSGTWNGAKADLVLINFDYRLPAVRTDVTVGKTETVTVASNGVTWDESKPGIFSAASKDAAADRLLPTYLLPHAVVYFGGLAADKVKLSKTAAGARMLTIPLPAPFNADLKATLDDKNFPIHTEIALNGKTYTGDFSNFTNDHMDYHVYGPNHIVIQTDGKVTDDLQVEYHWTDPYQTFATPKEVAAK